MFDVASFIAKWANAGKAFEMMGYAGKRFKAAKTDLGAIGRDLRAAHQRVEKWINKKGGKIEIVDDGTWIYTDALDRTVSYPNDSPDFKSAGFVKQECVLENGFEGYYKDFKNADLIAPNGPRNDETTTWHHHEDGKTMQEIDYNVHTDFRHRGGMSVTKNKLRGK